MLDEKQFVDGFEDVMEREKERFLKATTSEERDNARKGYLECANLAVKIQANDNNRLIEESKIAVEIEKKDADMALKARSLDEEFEIRYKQAKAETLKEIANFGKEALKIGAVVFFGWASFKYESAGNIYSGKTSSGFMNGIFRKPTDYLK